jgi:pimeloyl-ACP methyl ester carboxylesterase
MTLLTLGHRPHLFDRTILLDPVLFPPAFGLLNRSLNFLGLSDRNPMVKMTLKRRTTWADRESAFKALHGRGIYKGWNDICLRAFTDHCLSEDEQGAQLKCSPTTEAELFRGKTGPIWPSVRKVASPMTMVIGKNTYPFVKAGTAIAAKKYAPIERLTVDGGHCFMQEHPVETAELILKLLTQQ